MTNKPQDETTVTAVGYISIRDPDTGETILRRRDLEQPKHDR